MWHFPKWRYWKVKWLYEVNKGTFLFNAALQSFAVYLNSEAYSHRLCREVQQYHSFSRNAFCSCLNYSYRWLRQNLTLPPIEELNSIKISIHSFSAQSCLPWY
jgi:hypothetical protein